MAQSRGNMQRRAVVVDIDGILRIFKDYLGDAIPADAMPHALMKQSDTGLVGLQVAGNSWQGDRGTVRVDFQIKRLFSGSAGTPETPETGGAEGGLLEVKA